MSSSKILFHLCLSFISGIFLESIFDSPQIILWGVLFLAIIFIVSRRGAVMGFCILFFVLGILRVQITEFNIKNNELRKSNGTNVVFQGVIANEPDVRGDYQKLKVKTKDGIVLINADLYQKYEYLDIVKVSGKLETPQEFEDFNYKNYLAKDGIYSVMGFPKIEPAGKQKANIWQWFYKKVLWLKQKTRQSIQYSFNPPESSILEGTILGDNAAMSDELKNNLNTTGLRHIIAVSGTHVVILSSIIMSLLLMLGLRRGNAFYFAVVIICFYIVF
ncbi:MAG TPA: ComEC family competence protein, partial [Candidatus Staskawiczbacteria bacterium]|nr:ComEC family competence protein [Candidatus Staskawiczbacteria bacterium]